MHMDESGDEAPPDDFVNKAPSVEIHYVYNAQLIYFEAIMYLLK